MLRILDEIKNLHITLYLAKILVFLFSKKENTHNLKINNSSFSLESKNCSILSEIWMRVI